MTLSERADELEERMMNELNERIATKSVLFNMGDGKVEMESGAVHASLQNFEFGPDLKSMLSPDVRSWLEQHGLSGRVNIPLLDYTPPAKPGDRPGYTVKLELQGVRLSVHPEEWMGVREHHILNDVRDVFSTLRIAGIAFLTPHTNWTCSGGSIRPSSTRFSAW